MLTIEQLEEKYNKYLIDCFDFSPPQGWLNIVDTLLYELVICEPKLSISQVKEKFGQLRVHCNAQSQIAFGLIEAAEIESNLTCQVCGEPGVNRNCGGGWYTTLCGKHFIERISKLNTKEKAKMFVEHIANCIPFSSVNEFTCSFNNFDPSGMTHECRPLYESFRNLACDNRQRIIKEVLERRPKE